MLPSQLYSSIIDVERKGITETSLKIAARSVAASYNTKALKTGDTYLDYSKPQNRCAYLYKYAVVHTSLVTKTFRKLIQNKAIKKVLSKKKDIKVSSLGGGPGTDIVGIFRALSVFPHMHRKVNEATILDLSIGWHNSFNHIIRNLVAGKVKDISNTFLKETFKANFLEVNLLQPLPSHAVEAICRADVISMVKFVSAVLGNKDSLVALKAIADMFKTGAIVLFIDNFQGNVAQSIENISKQAGLKIILGPEVEGFHLNSESNRNLFGCAPLKDARVTVLGLMKTEEARPNLKNILNVNLMNNNDGESDDGWDTESEDSNIGVEESFAESPQRFSQALKDCDKFVNARKLLAENDNNLTPTVVKNLNELASAMTDLLSVMTKLKLNEQCCCCPHH